MADLILSGTTLGAASKPFVVRTEAHVTSIAVGLAGGEVATLQISPDGGQTWMNVLPLVSTQLTATVPSRRIVEPGLYRYDKGVTIAVVPLYVATEANA